MRPRRPEPWLVVLGSTSLVAWSMLALGGSGTALPAFCSAATLPPAAAALDLALVLNSPARLASSWALMVAAMMAPLIVAPLRHVHDRSLARRRARAMLLFAAGYAAVWMAAGAALAIAALAARALAPEPPLALGLAAAAAAAWQVSPAKQWCLNRCHRQPALAAFGAAADRDAFAYGLRNGVWCAGACWALMLLPLLVGRGHLLGMIAVALFVCAERLEDPARPAWRWRGAGKALRIVTAQARLRLAPQRRALPAQPTAGPAEFAKAS